MGKIIHTLSNLKSYWSTPPKGKYLSIKEMGAYSVGGMGVSFMVNTLGLLITAELIPYFYRIDIMHGRNIFTLVILLNLIAQPLLGKLLDNANSKWGKFKPFLIFLTPIVGLLTIMACFVPQYEDETSRVIYAYLTCVPVMVLNAFWFNIYNMIPSAMTPNRQERVNLLSPAGLVSSMAPTILLVIIGPLRNYYYTQGAEYLAARYMAIASVIFSLILTYLIVFYTKERVYIINKNVNKIKFLEGMRKVTKNIPFVMWCLASIFIATRILVFLNIAFIANARFHPDYGKGYELFSFLSPITGFGATPAMIFAPLFCKKFSKKTILITANMVMLILYGLIMITGVEFLAIGVPSIVYFTILGFFNSFIAGLFIVIVPAMMAEMYDYQQYKTGERIEGFMGGFGAWVTGVGTALILYIPTIIQRRMGFNVNLPEFNTSLIFQPDNMEIAVRWFDATVIISFVSTIIFISILLFYKLDNKEHERIMEEIKDKAVAATFDDKMDNQIEVIKQG